MCVFWGGGGGGVFSLCFWGSVFQLMGLGTCVEGLSGLFGVGALYTNIQE